VTRYERHIFVCVNERSPDDPRGSCAAKGSAEIRDRLKAELKQRGLSRRMRANQAGCLDLCELGPTVVVYPEQVWYAGVTIADVPEIIERHLIGGEPVERLRVPESRWPALPAPAAKSAKPPKPEKSAKS
jgi:(2Fe-2S) ferredoxin